MVLSHLVEPALREPKQSTLVKWFRAKVEYAS